MIDIDKTLKENWGYDSFRPLQREIISDILLGHNTIGVLPTGAGKSLCYMLPAKYLMGTVIVVSPLISLIKDQTEIANKVNLKAGTINSMTEKLQRPKILHNFKIGYYDIIFVSPEMIMSFPFKAALKNAIVSLWVIDEAHCLCSWGAEFRPSYFDAADIIKNYVNKTLSTSIAAFTATATQATISGLMFALDIKKANIYQGSFYRSNLKIKVVKKEIGIIDQIVEFVLKHEGDGIIYHTTRHATESTARHLRAKGILALPYHAGLAADERILTQDTFMKGNCRVIVATIAFGMGIDKPDIRWILHADVSKNIEGYYQEIGRAGRDGNNSVCTLLFDMSDITPLRRMIIRSATDRSYRERCIADLITMMRYAEYKKECRWRTICDYFDEEIEPCGTCDNCLKKIKEVNK